MPFGAQGRRVYETHPVVCGRRICGKCSRWKLAVDFKWQWKIVKKPSGRVNKRNAKNPPFRYEGKWYRGPYIDNVCATCRALRSRRRQQNIVEMMSPEERKRFYREKVHREAERRRLAPIKLEQRMKKLDKQIVTVRAVLKDDGKEYTTEGGNTMLPFLPFRLWLLRRLRQEESVNVFAKSISMDEAIIRRWAEGVTWESDCTPVPIMRISMRVVDEVLVKSGSNETLNDLYPWGDN